MLFWKIYLIIFIRFFDENLILVRFGIDFFVFWRKFFILIEIYEYVSNKIIFN